MESLPLFENSDVYWLLLGAALMAIEVIFIPGVGFLFAGLGAITIGIAIARGWIEYADLTAQLGWFFAATTVWGAVLWVPLKRFLRHDRVDYSNIVGSIAVVIDEPLTKDKRGKVKWSGTTMIAMVDKKSPLSTIDVGTEVEVISTKGNMLMVQSVGDLPTMSD